MTDIRTNAPGLDMLRQGTGPGAQVGQSTGSFKTAKAEIIDTNSLIADAAEELVSAFSEETEKDVSERDVEDGKKADSLEQAECGLTHMKQIYSWLDAEHPRRKQLSQAIKMHEQALAKLRARSARK